MRRLRTRSRFIKILLSYFLVIVAPLMLISAGYLYNSSKRIEQKYKETSLADLSYISEGMETLLNTVESTSLQLSLKPSLNQLLNRPFDAGMYDYYALKEDLLSFIAPNQMFYSIYIYFKLGDRVLTTREGLYPRNSFYDREILDEAVANEKNNKWYATRQLTDPKENLGIANVITFSKAIPVTGKPVLGNLVVNMKEEILFNVLQTFSSENAYDIFIIDAQGRVVTRRIQERNSEPLKDFNTLGPLLADGKGVRTDTLATEKYYITYIKAPGSGWTYISLAPINKLREQLAVETVIIIKIFIATCILGLLLSYFFSVKMYAPWKLLTAKISAQFSPPNQAYESSDEYTMLNSALDHMIRDNSHIHKLIEENRPVIRDRLISDLLWGNIYSLEYLKEKMEYARVRFPFPCFMAAAVSIQGFGDADSMKARGDLRTYIRGMVEEAFQKDYHAAGILYDEDKLAFILNMEQQSLEADFKAELTTLCRQMNAKLKERFQLYACFSFGLICRDIQEIGSSFIYAKRNLNYKAVLDEGEVLFHLGQEMSLLYPNDLHKQIVNGIKAYNCENVENAVDKVFDSYVFKGNAVSYHKLQMMIITLLGAVTSELWQEGLNLEAVFERDIYAMIAECENSRSLKKLITDYFLQMIRTQESMNQLQNYGSYVHKAVRFMEQNFHRNISILDIAEYVGLNATYLGRIFKISRGRTLVEYLTCFRMQKAKELFADPGISLQDISRRIGYNDVHSFIRNFKKYEGMTPGEYRSAIVQNSTGM